MSLDRTAEYRAKFNSASQKSSEESAAKAAGIKAKLEQLEAEHPAVAALFKTSDKDWIYEGVYRGFEGPKAPKGSFFLLREMKAERGDTIDDRRFELKVIDASVRGIIDEMLKLRNADGNCRSIFSTKDDLSEKS